MQPDSNKKVSGKVGSIQILHAPHLTLVPPRGVGDETDAGRTWEELKPHIRV